MDQNLQNQKPIDERSISAPLLIGAITLTAILMAISTFWAATDSSIGSLLIAQIGVGLAGIVVLVTLMPTQCVIRVNRQRSVACRVQNRRWTFDAFAGAMALAVLANLAVSAT